MTKQTDKEREFEINKIKQDAWLYGSGFVVIDSLGAIKHVPHELVTIKGHDKPPSD